MLDALSARDKLNKRLAAKAKLTLEEQGFYVWDEEELEEEIEEAILLNLNSITLMRRSLDIEQIRDLIGLGYTIKYFGDEIQILF